MDQMGFLEFVDGINAPMLPFCTVCVSVLQVSLAFGHEWNESEICLLNGCENIELTLRRATQSRTLVTKLISAMISEKSAKTINMLRTVSNIDKVNNDANNLSIDWLILTMLVTHIDKLIGYYIVTIVCGTWCSQSIAIDIKDSRSDCKEWQKL